MKYIVVSGGVCSGIGKGVVSSSIGALLKASNVRVTSIKIDPYINVDAGTFSPYEHGEVFVLNDGCEVDLDLGNYERFLDQDLQSANNITTGKINQRVYSRERQGAYMGSTVQVVPHITDAIQEWIEETAKIKQNGLEPQVCIIELGGTIGDIEVEQYLEALRQLKRRVQRENFCCCHVSLVPHVGQSKEHKTKPTQMSVKALRGLGLTADIIICRSETPVNDSVRAKISNFCEVEMHNIFSLPNLDTIYRVPMELERQGMIRTLSSCLKLDNICAGDRLSKWQTISDIAVNARDQVSIALVGKYTALSDCYLSVTKSLEHACYSLQARPRLRLIDSALLENGDNQAWQDLKSSHCLIVPGGFGIRGVEGKIAAIKWARENKLPFLGICLGFQMAVVEYARNVMGMKNAHSGEFGPELKELGRDFVPLVIEMLEYKDPEGKMGGTMRLGLRKTMFNNDKSILRKAYGNKDVIEERHRHRYEINPDHIEALEKAGLLFVGKNDDGTRMEILELDPSVHPYFVAVQYHPEYLTRPFSPSPPYKALIQAGLEVCHKSQNGLSNSK